MDDSSDKNIGHDGIVARYYKKIATFIHRRVKSHEDGEDILQTVFSRLAETDELALPVDQALPWLFRVARNLITDFWRKRKGLLFSDSEDDDLEEIVELLASEKSDEPETAYLQELFWTEFRNALSELPPEQREVFEMTEFEDLSFREISEQTGVNINTLLSRKRYATEFLRNRLREVRNMIVE